MTDSISHRGPDDSGLEVLLDGRLILGHRRLAILDLSPLGHQPMQWAGGGYWIAFNGEVYNFRTIRSELERLGHSFKSESDTEVVLASFSEWGKGCFEKFRGMFALAIWDARRQRLILARDRFGVKPLYYTLANGLLAFGSELRTLLAADVVQRDVDGAALAEYLRFGYITSPSCILSGVRSVLPGQVIEFDGKLTQYPHQYWSTTAEFAGGSGTQLASELRRCSEDELIERAEETLFESFNLRMVSDVPVGLFLSGGIDSSLVAALIAKKGGVKLRTFTIGYSDKEFDESGYARAVAQEIGATHTEKIVDPAEALRLCGEIPNVFDEPMADSSCIPTLMVCKLAREQVKVALSADGADELFGGYARYHVVERLVRQRQGLAGVLVGLGIDAMNLLPRSFLASAYRMSAGRGPRYAAIEDKLRKFQAMSRAGTELDAYRAAVSEWSYDPARRFMCARPSNDSTPEATWNAMDGHDIRQKMMHFDACRYLPGDLLTKVDRASMSVALESREPFLDQEIVRFAAALPIEWKIRGKSGKYVLRRILARHFPAGFFDRPKQGFSAPIGSWLRGPLRESLRDTLSPSAVNRTGLLDSKQVNRTIDQFLAGGTDASAAAIWTLYQLQAWADRWLVRKM